MPTHSYPYETCDPAEIDRKAKELEPTWRKQWRDDGDLRRQFPDLAAFLAHRKRELCQASIRRSFQTR